MTALQEFSVTLGEVDRPAVSLSAKLVGREQELAAVAVAAAAPPSIVLIEGESGIGKTRLVRELREHPAVAGRRFAVGACRAIAEPFPLGPVVEAVKKLRSQVPAAELSALTGVLRPLLPELGDVLPPAPEPQAHPGAGRHQVFRALREVLHSLSPLTLVLEDLHWVDELTIDLLRYLLGDPPLGLSLVLTMRSEDADPQVRALTLRLIPPGQRAHVWLTPLDKTQTGELAARLLAIDRVTDQFASYLRERTGGLPFAIEEVMALLRDRGVVARRGGGWSRRSLDMLAVPAAVRDHVRERASLLPPSARALVDIVSVLQSPAPEALVAQVAQLPAAAVAAQLSRAIDTGLLVDDATAIGFRHMLAAQAIYDALPGPRRRQLHNRAATAFLANGIAVSGQLAFHLQHAGRLEEWAQVAERAADKAAALGHFEEATRLLEEVLRRGAVATEAYVRLAVKLGWAARVTLRGFEVTDLLAKAITHDPPLAMKAELQLLLGAIMDDLILDWQESRALFQEAVEHLVRPDVKAWAMIALEIRNLPQTTYEQRRDWLTQVLELISRIVDPDFAVHLLGKVGMVQVSLGDPRWREVVARVEAQPGVVPTQRGQITACESISQSACFSGHHREADRLLGLVRLTDDLSREERLETFIAASRALIDYCQGRWDGLAVVVSGLLDRLGQQARAACKLHLISGDLAFATGELAVADKCYRMVADVLHEGADTSDVFPMMVASQIRLALARDDHIVAGQLAQSFIDRQAGQLVWPAIYRCLPWLAAALVRAGRTEQVLALIQQYRRELRGRDVPLEPAALAFAEGQVRAATADPTGAAELFLTAAAQYNELLCPFEAAHAQEAAAHALVQASAIEAVEQPLRAAMAAYQRLGASWDYARVVQAARRHGVSVPARHRGGHKGYGHALTPREREVAELAATGRTNKQIAEHLFLSAETVKKHLQAAMRKLGAPARAALARHLPPAGQV